jgi:GNAT superfamily N-acetyltransferase
LVHNCVIYRDATPRDADGISFAHVVSWQESYKGILDDQYLLSLKPESRTQMWRERLQDPNFDGHVIVAENDQGKIVGFIGVGPSRSEEFPHSRWGEIRAIYLLKDYKSKGIGRKLFELGTASLSKSGYKSFFCWVLKDNPTRRFYESVGGILSRHEKLIEIGGLPLGEVAYEWTMSWMFNARANS